MMQTLERPIQSKVRTASWTQLPPSPESISQLQGSSVQRVPQPTPFSLMDNVSSVTDGGDSCRLRSVANYEKFYPQALACSPPIFHSSGQSAQASAGEDYSSLGAISGEGGIALFRTSRPDAPVLMLSHSSMVRNSPSGGIQNLTFQPTLKDTVLLASSRGNGLLIWDASGHSLSPLMGRLSIDPDPNSSASSYDICSVSWLPSDGASSKIATTTSSYTSLWDLRVSLGAVSSKPSMRFGSLSNSAPLIQAACSHMEECATMDSTGVVRVYDLRMVGGSKPRIMSLFSSFHFAGVGLASFRSSSNESWWVSWGFDAPSADAKVKLWSTVESTNKSDLNEFDSDTYWHMDGSNDRILPNSLSDTSPPLRSGVLIAQLTLPNLSCARICPSPLQDSIVTVSMTDGEGPRWKADLWKLSIGDDSVSESTDTFGLEKIRSISEDRSFGNWTLNPTGPLRCAELAVCPAPFPLRIGYENTEDSADDDRELLLCCMSTDGLVTTTVVTETPRSSLWTPSLAKDKHRIESRSIRYVPNERRGNTVSDAASALRKAFGGRHALDESRHPYFPHVDSVSPPVPARSVEKSNDNSADVDQGKSSSWLRADGILAPFDMDFGFVPITIEEASTGPASVASGEEGGGIELSIQQPRVAKRVSTDQVPCPRLCGATFSPGIGGLVGFNNGGIHKMWSWYMKNVQRKSAALKSSETMKDQSAYPRLKKDLDDMIIAAKDAQWGENQVNHDTEENESESSNDDPFEDLSSEDESIGPSGVDDKEKPNDVFQPYFADHRTSTTTSTSQPSIGAPNDTLGSVKPTLTTESQTIAKSEGDLVLVDRLPSASSFDGATSDVLAPVVRINFDTESKMFNGQTAGLAANLLLGDWNSVDPSRVVNNRQDGSHLAFGIDMSSSRLLYKHANMKSSREDGTQWSEIAQSSLDKPPILSTHSDPAVHLRADFSRSAIHSLERDDEAVHGGEYSLRPRGEESMVFLRKLLPSPYQSLMSPPDSHFLPNKLYFTDMKRSASSHAIMQSGKGPSFLGSPSTKESFKASYNMNASDKVGVFTMPIEHAAGQPSMTGSWLKLICMYNANVCAEYGQNQKADSWSILAHAVDNHFLDESSSDSFSGWNGSEIGRELVGSLLTFYETQGDIQMVASIVCVLNTTRHADSDQSFASLLPTDQIDKYDAYIRRYAELVFRWGLLTKRVELLKHLSRHLSPTDIALSLHSYQIQKEDLANMDSNGASKFGISFSGNCHRCSAAISTSKSNVCTNCRDYAVRCSLCDNAVRGLFTVCPICGHGGHLDHVMGWFAVETKCPTGCGCECVFSSSSQDVRDSPSALLVAEESDLLQAQNLHQSFAVL